ncbi:MAG: heme biosynthesis protein HemY [Gammaproteobacteria bacterium]|nr:heme biosynthesis protein HemY [Gammaproteobacteria bacterium]
MFKLIVRSLILIIVVLGAVLLVKDDPGFVLIKYADFSVETSLAFAIVAMIVAMVVILFALRLLRGIWHLPDSMRQQSEKRRLTRSRKLLNQGLIDLAEGKFAQAENNLIRLVDSSESPLLHYLAAARAAQLQGKHDERDNYLKAAHEARPEAEIAIGVTQAELQLAHQQDEQALATLNHLRSIAPRHDYVVMLLARVYCELEDWQPLVDMLPEVRKKKLIPDYRLKKMEAQAYQGMLDAVAISGDVIALEKAWYKIPGSNRAEPGLLLHYIGLVNQLGVKLDSAENLIIKALEQGWDDRMIEVYGEYQASDVNAQLKQAEKWLTDYSQNENLLLALGRICMRARLWGKAQGYLEASIGIRAKPACCLALAELFGEHLKEQEKASKYYQMGLELSLKNG